MEPTTTATPAAAASAALGSPVDVVRILLLVLGGIAVTSTLEVFLVGAFTGFAPTACPIPPRSSAATSAARCTP